MFVPHWLRQLTQQWSLFSRVYRHRAGRALILSRRGVWLQLEVLEDRCLLSSTITYLGDLGGNFSKANGVNGAGQVVGQAETSSGVYHAFLYSKDQSGKMNMLDLGTLPGDVSSYASAINDAGVLVGTSSTSTGVNHAFLYSNGKMTYLGTLPGDISSTALGINDAGEVVGTSTTSTSSDAVDHAFVYSDGQMTYLGTLGGADSEATAINDAGQVVGESQTANGDDHAFLASKDQNGNWHMTDLGTLGGTFSTATGINNSGQVVGTSWTSNSDVHAFLYSIDKNGNGQMTDLETLGGNYSNASCLNDQGLIVGDSNSVNNSITQTPFLDIDDQMYALDYFLPPNSGWWGLLGGTAINDSGQIVGVGVYNGYEHAFLLNLNFYSLPQVTPTSLTWDKTTGGVDLSYQVSGANMTKNVPIAFYWANGPNYSDIIGPANSSSTYTVQAGAQAQAQSYGPIHINGNDLTGAPEGATYLLAVVDPNDTLGNFDPNKNVQSLKLGFPVDPVYQNQGYWAVSPGYLLGHSQKDTISSSGCGLTSLVMALNYQGVQVDPMQLNKLLTGAPNGYDGVDHMNWGPATAIAAASANAFVFFDAEDFGSSNPQDLRDLLTSNATPVIVSVDNPKTGNQHFVLVTGIDGNTFTINDPAYPDNTTLDDYDNVFNIRGSVLDPPNDLSALYFATAAGGTGANLAITDSLGNVTGLTTGSGQTLNQIPNSAYFVDGPVENLNGSPSDNTSAQFVYVSRPSNGTYGIQISGTNAPIQLDFSYAAPNGALQTQQAGAVQSSSNAPLQYQVDLGSGTTLPPPFIQLNNEPANVAGQVPPGTVGVAYTQTISASGGSGTLTMSYQITNGTIPTGLNFNATGDALTINGTPTASGRVGFMVTASDSNGDQTALNYSFTVNALPPPPRPVPPPPPSAPPALNVPPLLALFDSLLGGVETVNANDTETIVDSFFGFPLLVSTFDHSGRLVSVDLFGSIDITFLFG